MIHLPQELSNRKMHKLCKPRPIFKRLFSTLNEYNPISIYIHWPFCSSICHYCDFNRYVRDKVDHEKMRTAYQKLLENFFQSEYFDNRKIISIFFGGGTPSLA